ncbi:MAG TPA: hypothetical protein VGQ72_09400 [Pyrinomonadaceae bacterium]|jgi:hypothetical protein|nr:hypothetical protein [Pyrinomonadaceae bacterium]
MLKKFASLLLIVLFCLAPAARALAGQPQTSVDQVKVKIAKIGVGEKAKAKITLKDGRQIKGYISRADDDDFVIRDRKTDAPTTVRYADVAKVDKSSGHSTARNLAIGIGIGVGAFLAIIAITFAHLND